MKCCICGEKIEVNAISGWEQGNNAEPVVKDGRCCDLCNAEVVFRKRMELLVEHVREREEKSKAERHEVDLWEDLP